MKGKTILSYVFFVGLGFLILYFLYQSQQQAYIEECALKGIPESDCNLKDRIINDFKIVKWHWILIISGVFMLSNVLRALRWNQILETENNSIKLFNGVGTLMVGYFANLGFPRIGEVVKIGLLARYENIPVEKVAASVVIDRIMDILCLLLVLLLSVMLAFPVFKDYLSQNLDLSTLQFLGVAAVVMTIIGLVSLYLINRWYKAGRITNRFLLKAVDRLNSFVQSLLSIRHISNLPLFLGYSLGIWVCYYLMTYWCFFAFDPVSHLTMTAGLVVFLFGTLGMVFPSPGGMGSYHFLVIQALLLYGISSLDANSFAYIIFFSINIFCNVFFGLVFLIMLPFYNQKKSELA